MIPDSLASQDARMAQNVLENSIAALKFGPTFSVPMGQVHYEDADRLNRELKKLFFERESEGEKWQKFPRFDTQHGALFESRFDLFYWPDEPVKELATFCHTALGALLRKITDYSDEEFQQLTFDYHAWFHITRQGGYQGMHNHPNASWSGIYCIDPGENVEERPDSGAVRFHDPRTDSSMYMDAGNRRLMSPWALVGQQVEHEAGKLVMFPSYLRHEIFPYLGERPRVVVAFNCWIKSPGELKQKGY